MVYDMSPEIPVLKKLKKNYMDINDSYFAAKIHQILKDFMGSYFLRKIFFICYMLKQLAEPLAFFTGT